MNKRTECYTIQRFFGSKITSSHLFLAITSKTLCVGLARVGWDSQKIIAGKMEDIMTADLGPPIHSLVIPGKMHFLELDMLKQFALRPTDFEVNEEKT